MSQPLEDKLAYNRKWLAEYRAKYGRGGKNAPRRRPTPPEVLSRRRSKGGQKAAQMIRDGVYQLTVPYATGNSSHGGRPRKEITIG